MTRFEILNKNKQYESVEDMVDYLFSSVNLEACFMCKRLGECRTENYVSESACKNAVRDFLLENQEGRAPQKARMLLHDGIILPIVSINYDAKLVTVHDEENKQTITTDFYCIQFQYDGMTKEEIAEFRRRIA